MLKIGLIETASYSDNYSNYSSLTKRNWEKNDKIANFTELATMRGVKNLSSIPKEKLNLKPIKSKFVILYFFLFNTEVLII